MKQEVINYNVSTDGSLGKFTEELIDDGNIISHVIPTKYEKTISGDYSIIKAIIIVTKQ